jgi:hypothetical protein
LSDSVAIEMSASFTTNVPSEAAAPSDKSGAA